MEHEWLLYISCGALAFAISLLLTPWAKKVSIKLGAVDYPRARGMHKKPMPRMGGLAIIAGFMVAILVMVPFNAELRTLKFVGFVIGALIIAVLGALDDIYSIKAGIKFLVQLVAGCVVAATGTRIYFISLFNTPLFDFIKSFDIAITVFWVVGVTNAFNLIDGIDGLAAGVSSIAGICLTVLCLMSGSPTAVMFAATITGACLGFLPRNFSPAEVIMGDTGATFLGFTLAVSSILGVFKTYAILSALIAILALALPLLDTLFAMARRFINKKPIMSADRGHLHHRLVDMGFTHKQAVVILYLLSAASAIVAVIIAVRDWSVAVVAAVSLCVALLMAYVYFSRLAERQRGEAESETKEAEKKEEAGYELDDK